MAFKGTLQLSHNTIPTNIAKPMYICFSALASALKLTHCWRGREGPLPLKDTYLEGPDRVMVIYLLNKILLIDMGIKSDKACSILAVIYK